MSTALKIDIPSKYDIIPIHTSDRAAFKACRRKWAWSSPSRRNLVPRIASHGVRIPLWFGTGIHYALERYYASSKIEDPVTVFETWFKLEWDGGLINESELAQYADRDPIPGPNPTTFWVKGLSDFLPTNEEELFMQHLELGKGMLEFYKDYAERNDDFTVISTEHIFSVPILDPEGNALYAEDHRTMPEGWEPTDAENKYGHLIHLGPQDRLLKQVHAKGKMDIIVELETGGYAIRDYKTTSRLDDDYFRHIDLDEQCTTYLWAAEREAELYDLPYKQVDYIDYVALRKNFPKPPTITSKGLPSINRQTESTTPEMFEKVIKDLNLTVVYENDIKLQEYFTYLVQQGEKQFIWPERVRRNKHQKENAGLRLYYEALDMLEHDIVLYPNPRKEYDCLNCIFRGPCIAAEDGSDWETMLEGNYIKNYDR